MYCGMDTLPIMIKVEKFENGLFFIGFKFDPARKKSSYCKKINGMTPVLKSHRLGPGKPDHHSGIGLFLIKHLRNVVHVHRTTSVHAEALRLISQLRC
jgi:hypothetical protein